MWCNGSLNKYRTLLGHNESDKQDNTQDSDEIPAKPSQLLWSKPKNLKNTNISANPDPFDRLHWDKESGHFTEEK